MIASRIRHSLRVLGVVAAGLAVVTTGATTALAAAADPATVAAAVKLTAPAVTSFNPTSGSIGTQVTIKGSGFTGATTVKFGKVTSQFTVSSSTRITATLPASAPAGVISVTTPGGSGSSSAQFTVEPGIALSAPGGHPNGSVTVAGAGFGAGEVVDLYLDATDETPLRPPCCRLRS